jgi:antirestriction protein
MEDMRIYVASLSDYNDGRLEGKWLDLSDYSDASELMEAIQEMLDEITEKYNDGEVREEWAVHDYEGIPSTLASEYMGEQDFQQIYDIAEVAEDRGIPLEVLMERAGDTGSDDYQALADSLMFVVDGNDESDIVAEYEDQIGGLGNEFWSNHIYVDDVTERVIYGEDVDRFREDILSENPDLEEEEAEAEAERMADAEAEMREDLPSYLDEMGYGDEIPSWVSKDYEGAWKRSLSYDFDVIHHDGEMYVFSNNYSVGGTILSGMIGAYIGYKYAETKRKGKKLFAGGGFLSTEEQKRFEELDEKMNAYLEGKGEPSSKEMLEHAKLKHKRNLAKNPLYKKQMDWEKSVEGKGEYAGGGGIGFKGLSAKVAKRYEGKKPEAKYRGEYGKRYSKSEAKEVGDKVAGKVYWQQKGRKMATGGGVDEDIQFAVVIKKDDKNYNKIGYSKLTEFIKDKQGNEFDKLYFEGKKLPTKYNANDLNYRVRELDTFTSTSGRKFILLKELTEDRRIYYYILHSDDKKVYTEGYNMDFIKSEIKRLTNGKNFYAKAGVRFAHGGMTQHGLRVGDKIIGSVDSRDEIWIIDNKRNAHVVNLDKGNRYEGGGGVEDKKTTPSHIVKLKQDFAEGGLNTRMRTWYMKTFPKDDRGQYMDLYNTFEDLWNALQNKQNVYNVIGEGDSIIRERLFDKLSQIKGVKYMDVYNLWLESDDDDYAQGGGISGLEDLIRG